MEFKYPTDDVINLLQEKGYIRGPFGSALKRADMIESGIPVYEQSNVIYNNRTFRYFISDEKAKKLKRFFVEENDLLISCSGTVGKVSIVNKDDEKGIISQALLTLRPDLEKILPKYLLYVLSSYYGYQSLTSISTGSVQVNLAPRKIVEKIQIPLPSIEKQRKIADILSALDDKIELNNQMNQTLEDMATTLFKEWFENFNFLNAEGKAYKDNGGEFKSSELGEIPIDWEVKCLKDISSKIGDGLHGTPKYTENGEYFFINGNNLVNGILEFNSKTKRANLEEYEKYKKELNLNTIFLSINGTLGNIAFYNNEKVFLSKSVCYINPLEDYYKVFILCLFKSNYFKQYLFNYANGTTIKNLSLKAIRKLTFSIDKDICIKFSNIIKPIFEQIQQNQQQNQTLKKQRDTLLPKLMSGEIRV